MPVSPEKQNDSSPAQIYSGRLKELNQLRAAERKRERLLGYGKVAIILPTFIAAVLCIHRPMVLECLLAPAGLFVLLAVLHDKAIRSLSFRERTIRFYERGMSRLEDRWAGTGETGDRFLDPQHPYARDLDLFGKTSLFELLCTAQTRAGEETLAKWLLAAAPVEEILARQSAIRDLRKRIAFKEKLATVAEKVRLGVQPETLSAWGERSPFFPSRTTRLVTSALAVLWILSLVSWAFWGFGIGAVAMSVLNLAWSHRLYSRWDEAADALEKADDDLGLLAEILAMLEHEHFSAPKLLELQATLTRSGIAPSDAIRKLARIAGYLESRRNVLVRLVDLFTFWSAQLVFAAERWQQEHGPHIRGWLSAVGEFEALIALSTYAYEHPRDVFPEFVAQGALPEDQGALFDIEGMTHPLMPERKAVPNHVKLGDGLQLIILSGPNMAGKSTFIRSVGVNAVLAQCGAPVRATRLRLSPLNVTASICVLDSLSGGVSRFYAEIHRIKLVVDLARGPVPVLFLLDELLSGTNSNDRLAGAQLVVRSLIQQGAIGMVSTHDLALAAIPETMAERAANYHFEDRFEDGKLAFDYRLKPGIVKTSNALELMRSIGLG